MSSEVRGRCETPSYFLSICEFLPFNLWRCGRLLCFRLLFAVANNCLCQIGDFENEFSVAICQIQQSTIAIASLGLLKPAEVVSKNYRYLLLFIARNEFRGKRSLGNALLFFVYLRVSYCQLVAPRQTCLCSGVVCYRKSLCLCSDCVRKRVFTHRSQTQQSSIATPSLRSALGFCHR